MLILLPPSEGKTAPRRGQPLDLSRLSSPSLTDARRELLDALIKTCAADPADAAAALGLGPTQRHLITDNAALTTAPTARVDRVYTGVLYDALSPATLSPAAKRRMTARVAVASALFGLIRPGDRIPAYRLSGGTVLPGVGSVASYWRGHLGEAMEAAASDGLVVDLRSAAYAPFWRVTDPSRTASIRVLTERQGQRKVVSHSNKATKGQLVRSLLEDGAHPGTPAGLTTAWRDLGWTVEVGPCGRGGTRLDVIVSD